VRVHRLHPLRLCQPFSWGTDRKLIPVSPPLPDQSKQLCTTRGILTQGLRGPAEGTPCRGS
jgi:hypothetical protein